MSVRRNAIANFAGQGWTALIGLAFIPIYIRLLGIEAYGLVGVFAVLQSWLAILDLGLTPTLSREMARFTARGNDPDAVRDLLRSVELVAAVVFALAVFAIALSSSWLATEWLRVQALPTDVVISSIVLMGLVIGFRLFEGVYRSGLIGLQRQVLLNEISVAAATIRSLGAVAVLLWIAPTITSFFIWQGIVSASTALILGVTLHRSLPPATRRIRTSWAPLREVWRFAAGTLALTVLGLVLSQSDKVVLSSILSLSSFAIYSVAYSVASTVRLLAVPIDQAVFPRLTELFQAGDEIALAALYHRASQFSVVLLAGVGAFLAVFGQQVLVLWMQDKELAAATYALLWILVIGMVLNGVMNTPYYLQMAAGWTKLLVTVNGILVLLFVPLVYGLSVVLGATGAAAAWVLLNVAYLLVVARLMHRRLLTGELKAWYLTDLAPPLLAAVAVASALRLLIPASDSPAISLLALAVALAGILAASALAATHVREGALAMARGWAGRP